jgi:hypothetical protein
VEFYLASTYRSFLASTYRSFLLSHDDPYTCVTHHTADFTVQPYSTQAAKAGFLTRTVTVDHSIIVVQLPHPYILSKWPVLHVPPKKLNHPEPSEAKWYAEERESRFSRPHLQHAAKRLRVH